MERTLGLKFVTPSLLADKKYFLLTKLAKDINHVQWEDHIKRIHVGCHGQCNEDCWKCTLVYVQPNPCDTHWSKLTHCWASGHRSTFPSQIPLCLAPNGRFLPAMGKSNGESNTFSTAHLVTVIPLWRENEAENVLLRDLQGLMRDEVLE